MTVSKPSRRQALLGSLCGAGLLGIRSLATGLPISFLLDPRVARADPSCGTTPQFLILATSAAGDPVNANAPGSYDPRVVHPADPSMAPTQISLGGTSVTAAMPWSTLPQAALDRAAFFHCATLTNNHTDEQKVMALMGATKNEEMLVSICSKALQPCLGTLQPEPVVLGATGSGELLRYQGQMQPRLYPRGLKATLATPAGPLANLQAYRDADLDRINALLKQSRTPAEQAFLDQMALSQREVRGISQQLLDLLSAITADDQDNQVLAAAVLIKMKVSPVISVNINFANDNHSDPGFALETASLNSGMATVNTLMQQLATLGIQDQTTFAMWNVFGRTLDSNNGRNHYGNHHVTVMIGKNVKAGVVGGIDPANMVLRASPIDSTTGAASPGGDIAYEDTLASMGKTLGAALGVPPSVLDDAVASGKIVQGALA
jgi:hypothetical protein